MPKAGKNPAGGKQAKAPDAQILPPKPTTSRPPGDRTPEPALVAENTRLRRRVLALERALRQPASPPSNPRTDELETRVAQRTAELAEQKILLESIINQAQDGIMVCDAAGTPIIVNEAGKRLSLDPAAPTLPQINPSDWGQVLDDHDQPLDLCEWPLVRALSGQITQGKTLRMVRPNGQKIDLLLSATPLTKPDGTLLGAVTVFADITVQRQTTLELKKIQAELEQRVDERTQELKKTNKMLREADQRKDQFLAMLAHELRNPLSPILTTLELIRRHPCAQDKHLLQWSATILRQANHLSRIVDDLLDTSRMALDMIFLKKEPVRLSDALNQAVETNMISIQSKHQELRLLLPAEPITVLADPVRLVQIISNLLNNASKYTPEAGWISLSARQNQDYVMVEVTDSGVGMAPAVLPRIFDTFYQADTSLARSQGGLGLGLTLAQQLARLHGWSITAHSQGLGTGSTFRLIIPDEKFPAAVTESPARPAPSPSAPLRILVVEDNRDAAYSMAEVLALWGHEAFLAHDGQAGIHEALRLTPDVILLDIGLPDKNGYEVAQTLREMGLPNTVLIALTGYNPDPAQIHTAGFNYYFTKPVDLMKLDVLLRRIRPAAPPGE